MTVYLFRTPVRNVDGPRLTTVRNPPDPDGYPEGPRLMRHVKRPGTPVAVLITGTTITESPAPTQVQMAAATYVFMGGHENIIEDAAVAALLAAAGYEILPSTFGYGQGGYGEDQYGT